MSDLLATLELSPLSLVGAIDSGAEEELFRGVGQRVVRKVLVERWQAADGPVILQCERCTQSLKPFGRRKKTLRTLCGPVRIERRMYYCSQCRETKRHWTSDSESSRRG